MLSIVESVLVDLERAGVRFEAGLTDSEVERVESIAGASFCEEHRELLREALPVAGGRGRDPDTLWPDWRGWDDAQVAAALADPFEALHGHIRSLQFWMPAWGSPPPTPDARLEVALAALAGAPRLAPFRSFQYLVMDPTPFPSPVFSAYEDDVIYYGCDLEEYVARTFGRATWAPYRPTTGRRIPFWSDVAEGLGRWADT